jgi:hypothetical protein
MENLAKDKKLIIMITIIAAAVAVATIFAFVVLAASGNNSIQLIGGMEGIMMQDRMQMQAPEDVMILFESESQVLAGRQTQVLLKILDKQTNATMQGAEVLIGIEKGLPMSTMDMIGGMFNAAEGGNGTYAFTFTPESKGYYTVHAHIIPPGEQMHSMMENHVDFVIISQ